MTDHVCSQEPEHVLRDTLDFFKDEDYWYDGNNEHTYMKGFSEHGIMCISTSLTAHGDYPYHQAHNLVLKELGFTEVGQLWHWNDDPNTTFEDVILVLKRALAKAEQS